MTTTSGPRTFFGLPKLPARYATIITPFFLSIFMSGLVALVSTLMNMGLVPGILRIWVSAWATSWVIAFPALSLALPLARRMTAAFVDFSA